MGLFSSNKKEELALIFDVGSSSVGGALFYLEPSGAPRIIYALRESIRLEEELDIEKLFPSTLDALNTIASKICLKGLGTPKKIFCVLSSPWYASQTRTIKLEKNTPFIFDNTLADSLIQKEITLAEDEYFTKYAHLGNSIKPIEFKNMKTVLNGYATSNPYGQKAQELEMKVFVSIAEEEVLNQMQKVITRHFHTERVIFASFMMSSFTVARDMFINQDSFLLVNIGGEITDIAIIKKDILSESISYPLGTNFVIRGIQSASSFTLEEAKSVFSLYKDGHIAENQKMDIEKTLTSLRSTWLRKFQESLSNLTNDLSMPATIFITVEPKFAEFFSEIIKTDQLNQYTLTESKFRIIFLGTETLHGIASIENDTLRDMFLIIEAIYANRFLK